MPRTFLILLVSFFTQNLFSQFYIKGKVADSETQLVLKGASVYINNSTIGTIADDQGNFEIGPVTPGRYEVITSYVGYESILYEASIKETSLKILFNLDKKEQVMHEVLVLSSDSRKKYLEIFKKYVLGISNAAEKSYIRNPEEVQFFSGNNKDEILAHTEKELVIENPELGYTIYFELLDFYFNRASGASYFYGYTRFEDWEKNAGIKKWDKKRKHVYLGSTVHFFRSLTGKQLDEQGFTVYQTIKLSKEQMENANVSGSKKKSKQNDDVTLQQKISADSMLSLYSDSTYRIFRLCISDEWRIFYNKNTDLKKEIVLKGFIGQPSSGTLSGLRLREDPVLINDKGIILTPIRVYYMGTWSYEKLANMLPVDYEPE